MTTLKACAYCRFWHPWRTVLLADDQPQMIGHCVIDDELLLGVPMAVVQGLTANDFVCDSFQEADQ